MTPLTERLNLSNLTLTVLLVTFTAIFVPEAAQATNGPATTLLARTAFDTIAADHSGQCLDLGRVSGNTLAVGQWDCQGQTTQRWTIQRSAGSSVVVNASSRQCLAVAADSTAAGAAVIQAPCTVASRFWNVIPSGNGVQLVARQSGLCATVLGASRIRGASLVLGACDTEAHKRFFVRGGVVGGDTPIHLIGRPSGLCAIVPDSGGAVQQACDATLNTQWTLQPYGVTTAGAYRIVAGDTGACLAVDVTAPGAGRDPGTRLLQTACTGQRAELWLPRGQAGTSAYRLQSNLSNLCLDVADASLASGAALVQSRCSNTAPSQNWTLAYATPRASWGNLLNLPLVPVAVANLPDGRVLGWSADAKTYFGNPGATTHTYSVIIDPTTREWTEYKVTSTNHDMFCPGTSNLPDGRILVSGGSSTKRTSLFDPFEQVADPWSRGGPMNIGRAYQGNTVLSNGDVFTLGGSWSGGISNKHAELYSVAAMDWDLLPGIPLPDDSDIIGPDEGGVYRGDNHLWLFAQADGWVFHAGPSAQMHWIDTKNGGAVSAGIPRGDDSYSINGNAVLFDTGRILKVGGAQNYDSGPVHKSAYLIDIRRRPAVSVKRLAPMNEARSFANSVVLPSGEVVVIGGQQQRSATNRALRLFYDDKGVQETELWDPKTEVFTKLNARIAVARNYHSVALLLPDGRVLSGGGGLCGTNVMNSTGCPGNHPDVQILTPPYLVNADGSLAARPTITSAPTTVSAGAVITVDTDRPVAELALLRLSSTTHTVNNDQRRIKLWFTSTRVPNRYRVTIPADRGAALPGYWMLFALNARGVPSIAKTIQVQ